MSRILEQGAAIPNPLAASGDHHRIIRRAYRASSGYGALITEAYAAWDELWADLGESHLDPRGFLCVSREPATRPSEYREGLEAGGFPFELHDPAAAAARWPFLEPGTFRYAYFSTEGGALHCRKIAAGLVGLAAANRGAEHLCRNSKVAAVDTEAGRVDLESGERAAGRPRRRDRRRLGAEALSRIRRRAEDLSHCGRLCRAAGRSCKRPGRRAPVILDVGGKTDGYIIPPTGGAGMKFGSGLHKVRDQRRGLEPAARGGRGRGDPRPVFAADRPDRRIPGHRAS